MSSDSKLKRYLKCELYQLRLAITTVSDSLRQMKRRRDEYLKLKRKGWKQRDLQLQISALQFQIVNKEAHVAELQIVYALLRGKNPYKGYLEFVSASPARKDRIVTLMRDYLLCFDNFHDIIRDQSAGRAEWTGEAVKYLLNPDLTDEQRKAVYKPIEFVNKMKQDEERKALLAAAAEATKEMFNGKSNGV